MLLHCSNSGSIIQYIIERDDDTVLRCVNILGFGGFIFDPLENMARYASLFADGTNSFLKQQARTSFRNIRVLSK